MYYTDVFKKLQVHFAIFSAAFRHSAPENPHFTATLAPNHEIKFGSNCIFGCFFGKFTEIRDFFCIKS